MSGLRQIAGPISFCVLLCCTETLLQRPLQCVGSLVDLVIWISLCCTRHRSLMIFVKGISAFSRERRCRLWARAAQHAARIRR